MLDARSIAVQGIGFEPRHVALLGFTRASPSETIAIISADATGLSEALGVLEGLGDLSGATVGVALARAELAIRVVRTKLAFAPTARVGAQPTPIGRVAATPTALSRISARPCLPTRVVRTRVSFLPAVTTRVQLDLATRKVQTKVSFVATTCTAVQVVATKGVTSSVTPTTKSALEASASSYTELGPSPTSAVKAKLSACFKGEPQA